MNMKERLLDDLKTAMREKDIMRKDVLQIVRAAVLNLEKDSKKELDDAGVLDILSKEYKKRAETIEEFAQGGRQDMVERYKAEMAIIEAYLPKQLSEDEIEALVRQAINSSGAKSARDMGMVMKVLMPQVKGVADGKLVNQIVKRLLN